MVLINNEETKEKLLEIAKYYQGCLDLKAVQAFLVSRGFPKQYDESLWDQYITAITKFPPCPICGELQTKSDGSDPRIPYCCLGNPQHNKWLRYAQPFIREKNPAKIIRDGKPVTLSFEEAIKLVSGA